MSEATIEEIDAAEVGGDGGETRTRPPVGPASLARPTRTVVHVSHELSLGGQEKLLVEIARHADRGRFKTVFVSLGGGGLVAEELESLGDDVRTLGKPSGLRPGLALELARLFRRLSADVVHTHDMRSLIHAAPAARLARVARVVHTRHGRSFGATHRQLAVVRGVSRLVDRFVCVSEDVARLSVEEGIAPQRLRTVLNGVDVERFGARPPAVDGPVVAVGRLSPEKDHANLIDAAAVARDLGRPFDVEIAGDGPCMPDLLRRIDDLGLGDRVKLLGVATDVAAVLARAGAFVLPSKSEGISLTLLEAMASRLATVATAVGGSPEVVVPGETGLLVPAEDARALAEAVLSLTPESRPAMGAAGRRRVEERFRIERTISEYESLYEE